MKGIDLLPSGKYRVRFYTDGKRKTKTFTHEKDAVKFHRQTLVDLERRDYFDDSKGDQLFRDFAPDYMATRTDLAVGTKHNYKSLLNTMLLPAFGDTKLRNLTVMMVDKWWAENSKRLVNRRNAYFLLSSMMKTALRWGLIRQSPCIVEKAGKDVAKPRPTFTTEDFRHILNFVPDEFHTFLWVTFSGSLRLGEAIGLNRGDFDPKTGVLRVERQEDDRDGRRLTNVKNGEIDDVPLYGDALDLLTTYVKKNPALPLAPMFSGAKTGRLPRGTIRKAWNKARIDSGLTEFHLHDLRHVSLTIWSHLPGMNLKDIQKRGRHRSTTSALRYQHADTARAQEFAAMAAKLTQ